VSRPRPSRAVVVEVTTVVRAPRELVFDVELDMDVHAASLSGSDERATTSTGRPGMGLGDEVTFVARHLGRRWRLTSRVTAYDRPHRFVDEQVAGPFHWLRHEHLFEPAGERATRMTDRMAFEAPLGPLGALVSRVVLGRYLTGLLRTRGQHVKRVAEAQST
jgi:ligand-binding SRPBCC domain-containing protein